MIKRTTLTLANDFIPVSFLSSFGMVSMDMFELFEYLLAIVNAII